MILNVENPNDVIKMLQMLTLLQYLAVIPPRMCKRSDSASLAGEGAGVARGVLCQLHPGNIYNNTI